MTLWIIIGVLVVIGLGVIGIYNGLVKLRNMVKNAWAQVDVQLKRRYDLIPNLVSTCKGYMEHERELLAEITKYRTQAADADTIVDKGVAESKLNQAMSRFNLVVENYPDLKANTNFLALQEELVSTENKVSFSRQHYNDAVFQYNTRIDVFPANMIAGQFKFKHAEVFAVEEAAEREAPKVAF